MDLATIIGLLAGTGLVVAAVIVGGSALMFINVPGILIVVGGTFATCLIKFSMGDVINSIKVVMKAFFVKLEPADKIIANMIALNQTARKEGLMALENEIPDDEFSAKAFRFMVDGFEQDRIEEMLNKDIQLTVQRHTIGQDIFKGMGSSAPAFGMIGTLIGLVQMLANMSNPQSIGPAMAVALLTTLYGALMANLVCLPIADKLALRSQREQENKKLILEAVLGIYKGLSGMVLEETLKIHLSPKERKKMNTEEKPAEAA